MPGLVAPGDKSLRPHCGASRPDLRLLARRKDNYAADREAAEQAIAANPGIVFDVRANRAFLARAVSYLAAECGIRQFLDLGTGLPTARNTHEVAQSVAPDSRIVYVDSDPIVLTHARALLTSTRREPPPTWMPTCASWTRS